jgi:uncharacterized membrane protein YczE
VSHGAAPRLRGTFLTRLAVLVAGLWIFALGIVMTLEAHLGLSPWDVLHQGIERNSPLSFGVASVLVGIALLVVTTLLGVRPGLGTVLNAVLIGLFIDLQVALDLVPSAADEPLVLRLMLDAGGVALVGIATALYIGAAMGAGPRDSLMLALVERLGWRVGVARTVIELGALAAGLVLGGTFGVGTLVFAFGIGAACEAAFWLLRHSPLVAPRALPAPA